MMHRRTIGRHAGTQRGIAGRTGCDGQRPRSAHRGTGSRRQATARTRRRRTSGDRPGGAGPAGAPAGSGCRCGCCEAVDGAGAGGRTRSGRRGGAGRRLTGLRIFDAEAERRRHDAPGRASAGPSAAEAAAPRAPVAGAGGRARFPVGACDPAGRGRARCRSVPAIRLGGGRARLPVGSCDPCGGRGRASLPVGSCDPVTCGRAAACGAAGASGSVRAAASIGGSSAGASSGRRLGRCLDRRCLGVDGRLFFRGRLLRWIDHRLGALHQPRRRQRGRRRLRGSGALPARLLAP